jgi:hypothetical protein
MKTLLSLVLLTLSLSADPVTPPVPEPIVDQPMETPTTDQPTPMEPDDLSMTVDEEDCVPAWTIDDDYGSFILNEFKMGYFRSADRKFRQTYDLGVLDLQLTSSFCVWKPLYIYGAVELINPHGRSHESHKRTVAWIVPLSLGLQYIQRITFDLKYCLTAGPRYFFFHQHTESNRVPRSVSKSGCGGFINTGFIYYLSNHITIDFFGEYSYKKMHFDSNSGDVPKGSHQIGGLTLGAGIGYFW